MSVRGDYWPVYLHHQQHNPVQYKLATVLMPVRRLLSLQCVVVQIFGWKDFFCFRRRCWSRTTLRCTWYIFCINEPALQQQRHIKRLNIFFYIGLQFLIGYRSQPLIILRYVFNFLLSPYPQGHQQPNTGCNRPPSGMATNRRQSTPLVTSPDWCFR